MFSITFCLLVTYMLYQIYRYGNSTHNHWCASIKCECKQTSHTVWSNMLNYLFNMKRRFLLHCNCENKKMSKTHRHIGQHIKICTTCGTEMRTELFTCITCNPNCMMFQCVEQSHWCELSLS